MAQGVLVEEGELLACEVVEGPAQHPRAQVLRQLGRAIARTAIHEQDLVAEAAQRADALRQVPLLVLRDDGRGEARHNRVLSRARKSVVEWSFGSPATSVRPP